MNCVSQEGPRRLVATPRTLWAVLLVSAICALAQAKVLPGTVSCSDYNCSHLGGARRLGLPDIDLPILGIVAMSGLLLAVSLSPWVVALLLGVIIGADAYLVTGMFRLGEYCPACIGFSGMLLFTSFAASLDPAICRKEERRAFVSVVALAAGSVLCMLVVTAPKQLESLAGSDPWAGRLTPSDGDEPRVEFFVDYGCPHCLEAGETLARILRDAPGTPIILRFKARPGDAQAELNARKVTAWVLSAGASDQRERILSFLEDHAGVPDFEQGTWEREILRWRQQDEILANRLGLSGVPWTGVWRGRRLLGSWLGRIDESAVRRVLGLE